MDDFLTIRIPEREFLLGGELSRQMRSVWGDDAVRVVEDALPREVDGFVLRRIRDYLDSERDRESGD